MLVTDLDGNETKWQISKGTSKDKRKKSKYHDRARQVIIKAYPTVIISEEIPIVLRRGKTCFLDFYLSLYKTAIEIQGEQHYKFIPHFHKTKLNFLSAKRRDAEKKEWCELNNIRLIELPYNEDDNEWYERIRKDGEGKGSVLG